MRNIGPKFDRDKFFVNQKRMSFKGKYYVYDEEGVELFYVERPFRLFGRRNIGVFADDSKRELILSLDQDHYLEIFQRNYTVTDDEGRVMARLSRNNDSESPRGFAIPLCHSTDHRFHSLRRTDRWDNQDRLPSPGAG